MKRATEPPKVMVVDDSSIVLDATRVVLEAAGMDVLIHGGAEGTVAIVLSQQPDILLIEVDLPRTPGDALASILRTTAPSHRTIVLLFSSMDAHLLRLKALKCGADGYIHKSVGSSELVAQIRRWLPGRAGQSGAAGDRAGAGHMSSTRIRAPKRSSPPRASSRPPRKLSGTQAIDTPAVLFVDDDREVLDAYRRDMAAERIVAEFVQSAERALARIRSQSPPDVVVCDILMPGMSGSELFYRAKAMDASWERRFVFVTGASSMSHVVEFLSGTDARVLHKPVEIDRLRHAISYAALARRVFSDARLRGR